MFELIFATNTLKSSIDVKLEIANVAFGFVPWLNCDKVDVGDNRFGMTS